MRKVIRSFLFCSMLFICACNLNSSYGKRVKINDTLEVYLKGDNVSEADARKLGDYLAELWKDAPNYKSMQLSKDKSIYVVRMVVNEKMVKEDSSLNLSFMAVKNLIETEVFPARPVSFIITDNGFNDIKSF